MNVFSYSCQNSAAEEDVSTMGTKRSLNQTYNCLSSGEMLIHNFSNDHKHSENKGSFLFHEQYCKSHCSPLPCVYEVRTCSIKLEYVSIIFSFKTQVHN